MCRDRLVDAPAAVPEETGSTLLLVPAGIVVLLILLAIVIDGAAAFLAQRQLADACTAAANDGATAALIIVAARHDLPPAYDHVKATALAERRTQALATRWGRPVETTVSTDGDALVVVLRGEAPLPIAPAVGGRQRVTLRVTCRAGVARR